jgi:hypothetical protein
MAANSCVPVLWKFALLFIDLTKPICICFSYQETHDSVG